jgi:hypothetical protein
LTAVTIRADPASHPLPHLMLFGPGFTGFALNVFFGVFDTFTLVRLRLS